MTDREAKCEELAAAMIGRKALRTDAMVEMAIELLGELEKIHGEGVYLGELRHLRSPEAGTGALGPASDVWCTGAVLYQALGFRAPLRPAAPLRSVRPDLPEPLCAVIDRALAIEKTARYATTPEMVTALRGALGSTGGMDLDWEEHEDRTIGVASFEESVASLAPPLPQPVTPATSTPVTPTTSTVAVADDAEAPDAPKPSSTPTPRPPPPERRNNTWLLVAAVLAAAGIVALAWYLGRG